MLFSLNLSMILTIDFLENAYSDMTPYEGMLQLTNELGARGIHASITAGGIQIIKNDFYSTAHTVESIQQVCKNLGVTLNFGKTDAQYKGEEKFIIKELSQSSKHMILLVYLEFSFEGRMKTSIIRYLLTA